MRPFLLPLEDGLPLRTALRISHRTADVAATSSSATPTSSQTGHYGLDSRQTPVSSGSVGREKNMAVGGPITGAAQASTM